MPADARSAGDKSGPRRPRTAPAWWESDGAARRESCRPPSQYAGAWCWRIRVASYRPRSRRAPLFGSTRCARSEWDGETACAMRGWTRSRLPTLERAREQTERLADPPSRHVGVIAAIGEQARNHPLDAAALLRGVTHQRGDVSHAQLEARGRARRLIV